MPLDDPSPHPPVVLHIDPHEDTRVMLAECLGPAGFRVEAARDGAEGLNRAFELKPDAVITEVLLPHVDGFDVCEILKTNAATCVAPIVVLTACTETWAVARLRRTGADAIVVKPCLPDVLAADLAALVENV